MDVLVILCYILLLPLILYPDGHHNLILGIGTNGDERLSSLDDMSRWFKSSVSDTNRRDFKNS